MAASRDMPAAFGQTVGGMYGGVTMMTLLLGWTVIKARLVAAIGYRLRVSQTD